MYERMYVRAHRLLTACVGTSSFLEVHSRGNYWLAQRYIPSLCLSTLSPVRQREYSLLLSQCWDLLSAIHEYNGACGAALRALGLAVELCPSNLRAIVNYAELCCREGLSSEARRIYQAVSPSTPEMEHRLAELDNRDVNDSTTGVATTLLRTILVGVPRMCNLPGAPRQCGRQPGAGVMGPPVFASALVWAETRLPATSAKILADGA